MGFRSLEESLSSITKRTRTVDGVEYTTFDAYLGVDPITRKPKRFFDKDRPRLVQRIKEFHSSIKRNGDVGALLTPMKIIDAKSAYDALEEAGVRMTLRDAIRDFLAGRTAARADSDVQVRDAYVEYVASFGPLQADHVKAVKYRVGHWVSSLKDGFRLKDITAQSVVNFVDGRFGASNKSWNNSLTYIRSFLNWCVSPERGYISDNPVRDVKRRQIEWKEPKYLAPWQAEKILRICEDAEDECPEMLAYTILNLLCGMRREEIIRMAKDEDAVRVNIQDETIRVAKPKGFQKGIRPRAFHIHKSALAWMKSFDFEDGVRGITTKTSLEVAAAAREAGVDVPNNAGRHTFITMHCAAYGDPAKTEAIVGTSATMRAQNYMGLASKMDGEAFFTIMPRG